MSKDRVILYTDGACRGNPGPGGWGVVMVFGAHRKILSGGTELTTNNRMELQAVIEGLKAVKKPSQLTIVTDSQYVMKGAMEWMSGWKLNHWQTAAKKPVKNQDLWVELDSLLNSHDVHWEWVRGHTGHPENEEADALACAAIDIHLNRNQ